MSVRSQIDDLISEHGDDVVAQAVRFLPRVIALIKRGRERRIGLALDSAHARIDDAVDARIRRDQGEGHE